MPRRRSDRRPLIIKNLPLYLGNSAWTWLQHLPLDKINSWADLR
jgi:hypothetical protein